MQTSFIKRGATLKNKNKKGNAMKEIKTTKNPYATNRGGKIEAPSQVGKGDPRATVTKGDDLRTGKRKSV